MLIRKSVDQDFAAMLAIINDAAGAYRSDPRGHVA